MKPVLVVAGAVAVFGLAAFSTPRAPLAKTAVVEVHCPEGGHAGFVTPVHLRIAVGDSVEWQMAGAVISDSIDIALKDRRQVWPFEGRLARRARGRFRSRGARQRGTYAYSVTLACPDASGAMHQVVIDPDIIIE